jgi:hypothetical protein
MASKIFEETLMQSVLRVKIRIGQELMLLEGVKM